MARTQRDRFASLTIVYKQADYIAMCIRCLLPFCQASVIVCSAKPFTRYNPTARVEFDEPDQTASILDDLRREFPQIVVIDGDFDCEEQMRNVGVANARRLGFDYLLVVDADEFYAKDGLSAIQDGILAHPDSDSWWGKMRVPFKYHDYVIDCENEYLPVAVNLRGGVEFYNRRVPKGSRLRLPADVVCFNMGFVLSDARMYEKTRTWSHAHQLPPRWYEEKWLHWSPSTRDLHTRVPPLWPRTRRFDPQQLPAALHDHPLANVWGGGQVRIVVLGAKGMPSVDGAGGVERGLHEVSKRLVAAGHEVIVYERGRHFGTRVDEGIVVRTVPFVNRRTLACWSHALMSLLDSLTGWRSVTVYHVHCAQNGFVCLLIRLVTRARVVLHVHGCEWRVKKWGVVMARLISLSCIVGTMASHDVVTVCRRSLRLLQWARISQTWFVPNGTPKEVPPLASQKCGIARLGVAADARFFLYAGRLVPQKRVDMLIQAFRRVDADVWLVIAGPTSHCDTHVAHLRELAKGDPRIVWVGQVNFGVLQTLYRRSLAVVVPSNAEGCSNVLLEALAFGCCIVASDIEENTALVGEASALFKSGNLASLVSALRDVTENRGKVERLRKASLDRSRSLPTWDVVADQFARIYEGKQVVSGVPPLLPRLSVRSEPSNC